MHVCIDLMDIICLYLLFTKSIVHTECTKLLIDQLLNSAAILICCVVIEAKLEATNTSIYLSITAEILWYLMQKK
jgi:hypothetical protein